MTKARVVRFAREAVLWTGGALGALCLASLLAGWLFNVTPLVFSSGSMSPTYDAGALGIAREVPGDELSVGDVVSVVNTDGDRVTHRIVAIDPAGGDVALTLQGDTNNVPDDEAYLVHSVDRVAFGIPFLGYVLVAATTPFGLLAIALLVGTSLYLGFGRRLVDRDGTRRRARVLLPLGVAGTLLAGVTLGIAGQVPWAFTSAYWTDTAAVTATATSSAVLDTTPPTLSAFGPAAGTTRSSSNNGVNGWRRNCSELDDAVCLTAVDTGSGVNYSSATFTLVRSAPITNTKSCWNGTDRVPGTDCAPVSAPNHNTGSGRIWSAAIDSHPPGTYTLTWRVSDNAGNQATVTIQFTVSL